MMAEKVYHSVEQRADPVTIALEELLTAQRQFPKVHGFGKRRGLSV
jgi:hypothetical protein